MTTDLAAISLLLRVITKDFVEKYGRNSFSFLSTQRKLTRQPLSNFFDKQVKGLDVLQC